MVAPIIVSREFLLWSQMLLLWSAANYGVAADPLKGETARFRWKRWTILFACRILFASACAWWFSRSMLVPGCLLLATLAQPALRSRLPMRWLAEFETTAIFLFTVGNWMLIRYFQLPSEWAPESVAPAKLAALCVLPSALLIVVRGGTYIVRGILRKSGTLSPHEMVRSVAVRFSVEDEASETEENPVLIAAAAEELPSAVDADEYNRGRLIGNLERIVLTIVVAAGSYAALAFLVAAKGVVRSDEFEKSRDFTEYFLIGSLSSVLVALCAGIALRFALIRLWPDLLTLQIQ